MCQIQEPLALEGQIEQEIVERLKPVLPGHSVEALPEKGWNFTSKKGAVLVAFAGARFGDTVSPGITAQQGSMSFEVAVLSRSLRRKDGLYKLMQKVRKTLLGWKPDQAQQPLALERITPASYEEKTYWLLIMTFSTAALLVAECPQEAGPPLTQIGVQLCQNIS